MFMIFLVLTNLTRVMESLNYDKPFTCNFSHSHFHPSNILDHLEIDLNQTKLKSIPSKTFDL